MMCAWARKLVQSTGSRVSPIAVCGPPSLPHGSFIEHSQGDSFSLHAILLSRQVTGTLVHHGGKISEFSSVARAAFGAAGIGKAHLCYTVVALSDLAVSGSEPTKASLPGTDFPKHIQIGAPKQWFLLFWGGAYPHKSPILGASAMG